MTPTQMLWTSLLLGLFVLLAGCYGLLYCLGRMRASRRLGYAAEDCLCASRDEYRTADM